VSRVAVANSSSLVSTLQTALNYLYFNDGSANPPSLKFWRDTVDLDGELAEPEHCIAPP